jgi:hypothetical protein
MVTTTRADQPTLTSRKQTAGLPQTEWKKILSEELDSQPARRIRMASGSDQRR